MINIRLSVYQPEIAQNVGTMLRLAACLGVPVDIIEPTGFPWNDQKMRRSGMDYIELANVTKFSSFDEFAKKKNGRIVLLDVKAKNNIYEFEFENNDIIMVGQESTGVPDDVFNVCEEKVLIPMTKGVRSLNVAISAGIGISEAIRQLKYKNNL